MDLDDVLLSQPVPTKGSGKAADRPTAVDDVILAQPVQQLPRACGGCTACCTAFRVESLAKPAGTRCPHAHRGCSIYPTRPTECRTFACGWLLGLGLPEDRPDRSGVILDLVWQGPRAVTLRVIEGPAHTVDRLLGEAIARLAGAGVEADVLFRPVDG